MTVIKNGGSLPKGIPGASWRNINLGDGFFWFYTYNFLAATGAAVTETLNFEFPFKLIAIYVTHTDNADALGTDALDWSFNIAPRNGLVNNFPIVSYTASATSQFAEIFGDNYLYPSGGYNFIQDTTATDRVRVVIVVQRRTI